MLQPLVQEKGQHQLIIGLKWDTPPVGKPVSLSLDVCWELDQWHWSWLGCLGGNSEMSSANVVALVVLGKESPAF